MNLGFIAGLEISDVLKIDECKVYTPLFACKKQWNQWKSMKMHEHQWHNIKAAEDQRKTTDADEKYTWKYVKIHETLMKTHEHTAGDHWKYAHNMLIIHTMLII